MPATRHSRKQTTRPARKHRLAMRPVADAIVAFALFVCVSVMAGAGPTAANPHIQAAGHVQSLSPAAQAAIASTGEQPAIVEIATTSPRAADAVYKRTSETAAWLLLSLAVSLLVAFNLAILSHMRRAYSTNAGRVRR